VSDRKDVICGFDPRTPDTPYYGATDVLDHFISPYYVSLASILATLELSVLLLMHGSQCIQGGGEGGGLLAPMVLPCCGLLVDDMDVDTGMPGGNEHAGGEAGSDQALVWLLVQWWFFLAVRPLVVAIYHHLNRSH
jgi:hypothetical protein